MMRLIKNMLAYLWTPFNRDDLWNLSLNGSYCTYNPLRVRKGMVFCHVKGITVDHRMKTGTGLRVEKVLGYDRYLVKVPFVVKCGGELGEVEQTSPFVVQCLGGTRKYVEGDWFVTYGQYKYDGVNGDGMRMAHQVNEHGVHVFHEPFVDFGEEYR
jgi:hypothetical protein